MSIRVLLISLLITTTLAGCAAFTDFKSKALKGMSQKQIETSAQTKHIKNVSPSKAKIQVPSSNCSYIIRDLSVPNATTVWCMPKVLGR